MAKDPQAKQIAQNLFNTYCIQCHGSDAKGSKGFPNLTDSDWLWGGDPDKIHETIEKGRVATMPAWGPALGEEGVKDVAHYVMSLSKPKGQYDEERAARGQALFSGPPANCFTCHGDKGQGIQGLGPNLTDDVWLWGGTQKSIIETITNGRSSQMPAWGHFLDKDKLHIMTAYVWGLSNKDGKAPVKKPSLHRRQNPHHLLLQKQHKPLLKPNLPQQNLKPRKKPHLPPKRMANRFMKPFVPPAMAMQFQVFPM